MNDSPSAHAKQVTGIFSRIAGVYDLINSILSFGIDRLWRKAQADLLAPVLLGKDPLILDLAAGTMELTKELAKRYPHAKILAVDFCLPMLKQGQKKTKHIMGKSLLAVGGDALRLPLPDKSVDAITVAFGLRNFSPRKEAMQEMHRVLKKGGMLCILEFGSARDRILFGFYNWYLATLLPQIGRLFSRDKSAYKYLASTILAFPSAEELLKEFEEADFKDVTFQRHTAGIVCIHQGIKK